MVSIRDKIASLAGCILEWYDFSLYGFFLPIIAVLYFPNNTASVACIKTLGIFSVGFLARPMGALLFGYISDKYGRTVCLKRTPLLITIPTACIALLPTYQQIGILAPLLLLIARVAQGLCIGGEFSNNIVYLCETAPIKRRYFFGSIGACTGSFGMLLGSSMASLCFIFFSHKTLLYGWRICFGLSILLGLFTYFIRRKMDETTVYKKLIQEVKTSENPIIESYRNQITDYLKAIGL